MSGKNFGQVRIAASGLMASVQMCIAAQCAAHGGAVFSGGHFNADVQHDALAARGQLTGASATPRPDASASLVTLLNRNARLSAGLQSLLPAELTPQEACAGFQHLGECVAAIHVASNLQIQFAELKSKLVGPGSSTLGDAIHGLRPSVNVGHEQRVAERQMRSDLAASSN